MTVASPILIAGPTASGKSALALALASKCNGVIINADALQVYDHWHVLTARPSADDEAAAPHRLYGHVPAQETYSVGAWLRDLRKVQMEAENQGLRPIIIGGTGLYFSALTQGLASIPDVPPEIRARADMIFAREGAGGFARDLAERDPRSLERLDRNNPARLQRAWEVLEATGVGISAWQARTGPPLMELADTVPIVLDADRDWLANRIAARFDVMLDAGALDEVRRWQGRALPRSLPAARALGAPELLEFLDGKLTLDTAVEKAVTATRQFAKRQRTWFRNRMDGWHRIDLSAGDPLAAVLPLLNPI